MDIYATLPFKFLPGHLSFATSTRAGCSQCDAGLPRNDLPNQMLCGWR